MEDEFYDLETFCSRAEFLGKASLFQFYFELARPNPHKRGLSPWQITQRLDPRSPVELCLLPPVFLDYYLNEKGGYDLRQLPYSFPPRAAQAARLANQGAAWPSGPRGAPRGYLSE